jgi:hypothetical protein
MGADTLADTVLAGFAIGAASVAADLTLVAAHCSTDADMEVATALCEVALAEPIERAATTRRPRLPGLAAVVDRLVACSLDWATAAAPTHLALTAADRVTGTLFRATSSACTAFADGTADRAADLRLRARAAPLDADVVRLQAGGITEAVAAAEGGAEEEVRRAADMVAAESIAGTAGIAAEPIVAVGVPARIPSVLMDDIGLLSTDRPLRKERA